LRIVQQLVANGLIAGSAYALVALGFSLIYTAARFFHFAHGAVYAAGAYSAFALVALLGFPVPVAVVVAVVVATLLGISMEVGVYRPLRRRHTSVLVLLISSLGIYIVIQNLISLGFGDDVKTLRNQVVSEGWLLSGARITPVQLAMVVSAVTLFALTWWVILAAKPGKALRAVANDPELALASGINSERVIVFAFAVGSALAAIAAILVSFDVDMVPTMGLNALLMGAVATIVGGVGSMPGAAVGGLLLGLAEQLGGWEIGSQWQDSIAFAILLLFLLFRPYGVFRRKLRKAEI